MKAPRITVPRALAAVLLLAFVAYGGAMIWLVANETRLVFEAQTTLGDRRPAAPLEIAGHSWLMRTADRPDTRPWVLFLHGNASTIASRMNILHYERLRALGLNVMAPDTADTAASKGRRAKPDWPTMPGALISIYASTNTSIPGASSSTAGRWVLPSP